MFFDKFVDEEITPPEGETMASSFVDRFNNFFCHFPLGNVPYPTDELTATLGRYRKQSKLNDRDDDSFKTDKYPKLLGLGEEDEVPVTRAEFYQDLYATVEECGMKMEDVSVALNPLHENMQTMKNLDWEKAFQTLAPIFKAMRNKGYSHKDLWG